MNNTQASRSGMRGFDAEFSDLPQYIRVITERIWEGRRTDDIHRYYSDLCIVETPLGVSTSVNEVITGTQATLTMFPDRRLLAEDIIVSGDDQQGYLSSHRIISPMTHLGDGSFGAASGKKVHARTIADCVCKDNRIIHEWLVRDHAAIALAIGTTPNALAVRWLAERGGWNKPAAGPPPEGYVSHFSSALHAKRYASAIEHFARNQQSEFDIAEIYDDAVHQIAPGEAHHYGHDELSAFWRALFAAFAVIEFRVEHLTENVSVERGTRVAMRWRAVARHAALGEFGQSFGTATARNVEIMGINHAEIVGGRVLREWVLIDEVALWMQVL